MRRTILSWTVAATLAFPLASTAPAQTASTSAQAQLNEQHVRALEQAAQRAREGAERGATERALVAGSIVDEVSSFGPGEEFRVRVEVVENPTGNAPINVAFRVHYPADVVDFDAAFGAQVGGIIIGPVEGEAPNNWRDFTTMPNFGNKDETPHVATLKFKVIATEPTPFSIRIENDPRSSGPLIGPTSRVRIPHNYDNSALEDLQVIVPQQINLQEEYTRDKVFTQGLFFLHSLAGRALSPHAEQPPQDLNGDGRVDFADGLLLMQWYRENGGRLATEIVD